MADFAFELSHKDKGTSARLGVIHTPHGDIQTPAFVPVGTQATVKAVTPDELMTLGVQLFFVNTYHAYLRPGLEVIKKFGGLHAFMGWHGPIITDSGGFQVFSLGREKSALGADENLDPASVSGGRSLHTHSPKEKVNPDKILSAPSANGSLVHISDDGVEFRSHWDGSLHFFTPEKSIDSQHKLGADITIAFDECTPYPTSHDYARRAMERTRRWAERSLSANEKLKKTRQALYGVVQGSVFEDLRKESAKCISSMNFDGIAIGGVSVGESKKEMVNVLDWVVPILPEEKPRHLLGVGEIDDIFALIERGIDTFDCVQPTRLARMGHVFVANLQIYKSDKSTNKKYEIDITKNEFAQDTKPIDRTCQCYTCQHFSRAYLHHLFHVRELLAYRLATIHNIHFVQTLVGDIRRAIGENRFLEFKNQWLYDR